ncbi:neogenin isoform X2 [Chelonus insularis]|uniref:neogenin isoform X2 n=1 Tax=Chelonus insularis TaxID=460826 RepID=UPI001588EC56|nr:neogenin-like isoform X2 [Chelonus insularis]
MEKIIQVFLALLITLIPRCMCAEGLDLIIEPQDVIVEPGGSARLDCKAYNTYANPVSIQWRTEDGQLINFIGDNYRSQLPNGSLYISNLYPENSELIGSYQCLVSVENVGSIVSRAAVIKLLTLPEFDQEPQDVITYPGQTVYLGCSLTNSDISNIERDRLQATKQIQWLKDEHPLILDESRMTLLTSGALEIDDVRLEDIGSYRCNVSMFSQHRLSRKAQLMLEAEQFEPSPSPPTFIARPKPQIAVEGSTITLECVANGVPKPSIHWLKDGIAVDLAALDSRYRKIAASSLMITDIMEEDHGSYQCRAKNEIETLDAVAQVIVHVPPRFIKRPEDKVANENQDLEFECQIYGKPEPKVTWLKNGEKITLSEYWQLVNNNNLRINGLLPIDAGIFQCIGTNPAGNIQASARLVINKPKKEKNLSKASVTTTPKTINKKKLFNRQFQKPLYNNTWQHPSTLLGHTLSAFTPNPPKIDLDPLADDSAELLSDKILIPKSLNHKPKPETHFLDNTDNFDSIKGQGGIPSAPRNLSAIIVKSRFVTLSWQEPENTNEDDQLIYYIYYKQDGSQRERVISVNRPQEMVVRGLQPGVTYQFRVVAHNSYGVHGVSSNILSVTTHSEANVPGPPLNIEAYATSSQSIKVSWQEPKIFNGRISKYVVTIMEGSDGEEKTKETTSTTCELTDLNPYTEYQIWVHAVNENGPGASTSEVSVRTFSAPPSQPPHNVTLEAASSTSVIVRWEPPLEGQNGIITGYKIRYRPQDRRYDSKTAITEGNKRLYVLMGLEKREVYHVRICALNMNGTGPWTEWMEVETYENDLDESNVPSAPTNLRTKPMSNSISLWWSPPKDEGIKVRGYKIGWGKGYPDVDHQELDGKQRYYTIENLDPLSEYVISLRATNEAGEGPPVYANVRTTEKTALESITPLIPPVGLKAIVLSANSVVLYWTDTLLSKSQYVTDNRYYVVRYAAYHPPLRYKFFNATDLNCMISDLKPNTLYEFTVKTVKGKRESPWSMVVLNQTYEAAPTSPPRELTVDNYESSSTSVILRWQPPKQPNGHIIGYIISYSTDNTKRDRDWMVDGLLGNKTEYIVKGLKPSTAYYFKIQARNGKGYGPFSSTVVFKTLSNGRGLSGMLIYIIVGCAVLLIIGGVAVVVVFVCCRRESDRKKGYLKDAAQKTNIKPPDLWIHHDQMELKALEKSSVNGGETCTSGIAATTSVNNTLPRSGNNDYNHDSNHPTSGSLDKRTYVPSYMASNNLDDKCSTLNRQHSRSSKSKLITLPVDSGGGSGGGSLHPSIATATATATTIVNCNSSSQPAIHSTCSDSSTRDSSRSIYGPRTVAQYSLSRAHITLEPTPESNVDSCLISNSSYEQSPTINYSGTSYSTSSGGQYTPGHYPGGSSSGGGGSNSSGSQLANTTLSSSGGNHPSTGALLSGSRDSNNSTPGTESGSIKRLQGHPLKSFSVPAPPPQSAPSTPAQQKHHGVSQANIRSNLSGSPYKKSGSSTLQLSSKNRLASVSNPCHTPEEMERLKPSYSTEELNQEMANLEGLMKDLNAITASEFEC